MSAVLIEEYVIIDYGLLLGHVRFTLRSIKIKNMRFITDIELAVVTQKILVMTVEFIEGII